MFRQFSFPIKCYSHVFTLVGKTVEGDRHVFVLFFVRSWASSDSWAFHIFWLLLLPHKIVLTIVLAFTAKWLPNGSGNVENWVEEILLLDDFFSYLIFLFTWKHIFIFHLFRRVSIKWFQLLLIGYFLVWHLCQSC